MTANVRFAESLLTDLQAVQAWYTGQGVPDADARLVPDIVMRVERLADHPEMGRAVPEFGEGSSRELIHPPFHIRPNFLMQLILTGCSIGVFVRVDGLILTTRRV